MLTPLLWKELYNGQPTLLSMLWLKILTYWSSFFHHRDNSKNDVFFNTEKKLKSANMNKWWDMEFFKEGDASDWMDGILFAHTLVVAQHELFIAKVSYFTYFLRLPYISPMKNWTPTLEQQKFFSYRSIKHFNLLFHTKCYLDANNDFSWSYWV